MAENLKLNSWKTLRLERLRARIVRDVQLSEWRDAWFFPPRDGVDGWRGTGRVMVVGLNPSTTYRWTPTIQRFYDLLKRARSSGASRPLPS
jgi:hypothetical protein